MSKPTARKLASLLLDEIASARVTLRRRITCTRHGHDLLPCANQDAVCRLCGRWFARREEAEA